MEYGGGGVVGQSRLALRGVCRQALLVAVKADNKSLPEMAPEDVQKANIACSTQRASEAPKTESQFPGKEDWKNAKGFFTLTTIPRRIKRPEFQKTIDSLLQIHPSWPIYLSVSIFLCPIYGADTHFAICPDTPICLVGSSEI